MKSLEQEQKEWFEINAPFGRELGYPECCIKEFCDQPPSTMNGSPTEDEILRYHAGCINSGLKGRVFSGFIPCASHAKQIMDGKISLSSLIQNRDKKFPPFPLLQ